MHFAEFGLYIHWPFCKKKCPYCDFNSYAFEFEPETWVNALIKEIQDSANIFSGHIVKTIFFGGGTPSLIPPDGIARIIEATQQHFKCFDDLEITLETNPSTIETYALEMFMKSGINRFSIGMQSLKDENLQFLGRLHSAQEAVEIITHAAKICENVSGDFIYTLPQDSLDTWKYDLTQILELANKINLKHLSLYQLTIEQGTAFERAVETKKFTPMNEDLQSELYMHTHETLSRENWDFYEISNAARLIDVPRGTESQLIDDSHNIDQSTNVPCGTKSSHKSQFRSQHNLIYWNYEYYLGIGPGAHSRMPHQSSRMKFNNFRNPYKWLNNITNESTDNFFTQKEDVEILSDEIQFQEKLLMGLRLTDGIKITSNEMQYLNLYNFDLLLKEKLINFENNTLKLPINGKLKTNAILKALL